MDLQRVVASVTALVFVGAVAGCSEQHPATAPDHPPSSGPSDVAESSANSHARPLVNDSVESWCEGRPEKVTCLPVSQGRHVVLIEAMEGSRSPGIVFWDPGGPGLALPDLETPLARLIPASIRTHDVAFLVEPWIELSPTPDCQARAATGSPPSSCELANLYSSDRDLASALDLVAARTGQEVVGAYLQSFGATRSSGVVSKRQGLKWSVLESPGPVPGSSAADLVAARVRSISQLLQGACGDRRCREAMRANLKSWTQHGVRGSATGREVALGVVALTSLPSQNAAAIQRLQRALERGEISSALGDQLRRLGRTHELRGASGVAPELIALWADTCPRLTDWDLLAKSSDPLTRAFFWIYRGCVGVPLRSSSQGRNAVPTMLLTGRRDTIVPPQVQAEWRRRLKDTTVVVGGEHVWDSSAVTSQVTEWIAAHERERG